MATFYWTIQLDSITPPSALEVGLGQDGNGTPLPASQHGSVVDTGQASPLDGATSTGLTGGTNYLVSWIWDDGAGDVRGPVSATFSTTGGTVYPVSIAEAIALADSQNSRATFVVARAESVALTASQTGVTAGEPANPPWGNVVTLLHNNGSGVFIDSSQYNWAITNDSANHGTPAKFGDAAQLLPGHFSIDGTALDLALGTGDLTVEIQLYRNESGAGSGWMLGWNAAGGTFNLGVSTFSDLMYELPGGGSGRTSFILTPSGYSYVVITRASGTWTIWQNLTQTWASTSNPAASVTPTGPMYYGRGSSGVSSAGAGLLDEIRITKGIALYTQAAPPTVLPTNPFPDGPLLPISVARAESVALSDSQNAVVVSGTASTVQETVALSHTQNAAAIYGRNRAEVITLTDQTSVASTAYAVARAESIALTATQTAATQTVYTGTVNESFSLNAQCDAYIGALPISKIGHFGEPPKWGAKEAERAMIQLEDEFILEIVLSLAVKGAIA